MACEIWPRALIETFVCSYQIGYLVVGNQQISCVNIGGSGNSRYVNVRGLTADFAQHATASNQTGSEGRSRNEAARVGTPALFQEKVRLLSQSDCN